MTSRYGDLGGLARPPAPPSRDSVHPTDSTAREIWTVSFATLLSEERARDLSTRIRVDGRTARVIAGNRDGIPIWRVVLGPFNTRDAAERAGMASRLPYWVFEGAP
jgi:cell division septation protein DedD